ncbi:MAG: cell division protein SepF [Acidimicrobiia bacterium]
MASLWNKTLFYLGLVDEDEQQPDSADASTTDVVSVTGVPTEAPPPPPQNGGSGSSVRPPGAGVSGRRVEPPPSTRRQMSSEREHAEAGLYVHPTSDSVTSQPVRRSEPESQIIVARNFSDAQTLADAIRGGRSVVLDLRSTEPEMVRRIVDFASGLTYALDGKMSKTAQGVILVSPSGVTLGIAEQERLSALGLYGTTR